MNFTNLKVLNLGEGAMFEFGGVLYVVRKRCGEGACSGCVFDSDDGESCYLPTLLGSCYCLLQPGCIIKLSDR